MNCIRTNDRLPEEGKYVLARYNRGTWIDSDDQQNVNCVVVKLVKGISLDERNRMKNGEISCQDERWKIYRSADEGDNNKRPYCWVTFGADKFFGQEIVEWMPIESSTLVYERVQNHIGLEQFFHPIINLL